MSRSLSCLMSLCVVLGLVACGDDAGAALTSEAAGTNCEHGGVRVETASETLFVCNGGDGSSPGITDEAPGANCAVGGIRIEAGGNTATVRMAACGSWMPKV